MWLAACKTLAVQPSMSILYQVSAYVWPRARGVSSLFPVPRGSATVVEAAPRCPGPPKAASSRDGQHTARAGL